MAWNIRRELLARNHFGLNVHEFHPVFEPPANPDVPIWRYMDLPKFLSMLEAEALQFARTDILSDDFEASISLATVAMRREFHADMPDENFSDFFGRRPPPRRESGAES